MRDVVDSVAQVILLTSLAWMVVMVGTGAALAHRLGWRAGYGALLGLIPIPFMGWLIVCAYARRNGSVRYAHFDSSTPLDTHPDDHGPSWSRPSTDDWNRP
jgi:hypothetical protein